MRRNRSFSGKWLLRAAMARGWLFSVGVGMLSLQAMPVDAAQSSGVAAHDLDVEATIAQTVYDCSLTKKAAAQQVDEQIRGQLRAIDRLRAQGIRARTQLAAAQRAFIRDLSAKDRAYAEAIERFRRDVTDLAATPEGKAALAQFNAGQEVEALAILDQLQAARDRAIALAATLEEDRHEDGLQQPKNSSSIHLSVYWFIEDRPSCLPPSASPGPPVPPAPAPPCANTSPSFPRVPMRPPPNPSSPPAAPRPTPPWSLPPMRCPSLSPRAPRTHPAPPLSKPPAPVRSHKPNRTARALPRPATTACATPPCWTPHSPACATPTDSHAASPPPPAAPSNAPFRTSPNTATPSPIGESSFLQRLIQHHKPSPLHASSPVTR